MHYYCIEYTIIIIGISHNIIHGSSEFINVRENNYNILAEFNRPYNEKYFLTMSCCLKK